MADTLKKIPIAPKPKDKKGCDLPSFRESDGLSCFYPSFSINDKQMPEVDAWEVEGRYRLVLDVVMTSKGSQRHSATRGGFDIVGYKILATKPPEEMTDKEFGEYQGKVLEKAAAKRT